MGCVWKFKKGKKRDGGGVCGGRLVEKKRISCCVVFPQSVLRVYVLSMPIEADETLPRCRRDTDRIHQRLGGRALPV